MAPSGLYARLCHVFSSFILFYMCGLLCEIYCIFLIAGSPNHFDFDTVLNELLGNMEHYDFDNDLCERGESCSQFEVVCKIHVLNNIHCVSKNDTDVVHYNLTITLTDFCNFLQRCC